MSRKHRAVGVSSDNFFRQLSPTSVVVFYVGVFLLFAPLPLLVASRIGPERELGVTLFWLVYSGLISVAWAASRTVWKWLLPVAIALTLGISLSWALRWPPALAMPMARPGLDGVGIVLILIAAYVVFVFFISGEGTRTLRMQAELALARQIHATLAPPIRRNVGGLQIVARSDASAEMGGDLIDMIERPDGGVDVFLADVSGHGVKAGVVMGMVKSAIRMRLLDGDRAGDSLGVLLTDLNRVVCQIGAPEMFVTFACVRFEADGRTAHFALAGHPPILRIPAGAGDMRAAPGGGARAPVERISAGVAVQRLENEFLPLGIDDTVEYRSGEVACAPGDVFVLYTDGLTEAANARGQQLGQGGFERIAIAHAGASVEAMSDGVFEAVRGHTAGAQIDDQTLLLVRLTER